MNEDANLNRWVETGSQPPPEDWLAHPSCPDQVAVYIRSRVWCDGCEAFQEAAPCGCEDGRLSMTDRAILGGDGRARSMYLVEIEPDPRTNPLEALADFCRRERVLKGAVLQLWHVAGELAPASLKLHQVNAINPSPAHQRLSLSLGGDPDQLKGQARARGLEAHRGGGDG